MRLPVYHPPPFKARVLFVRPAGVLFASQGSPEMTRRYVWAPILEDLLTPYPDVCIVFLRSHDEPQDDSMLKAHLGRLGQRVMEILTIDDASLVSTVSGWRRHHPEMVQGCLLASIGTAAGDMPGIDCDCELGVSAAGIRVRLQAWLETAQMAA